MNADRSWVLDALERFEGRLTLYARRHLGDADLARDVVQDTFLKLCEQERAAVEGHLQAWLFTVCRNRSLDLVRRNSRMHRTSETEVDGRPGIEPDPARVAERRDEVSNMLRTLETLPPNQQEVLDLKFRHGLTYREIAAVTKHSLGNVGFLIHTGLKTLRSRLDGRAAHA